jgi:hypothetical protein
MEMFDDYDDAGCGKLNKRQPSLHGRDCVN